MASTCLNTANPLFLPVTYHNVANHGTTALAWGIKIALGEPEQTFAMWPMMEDFSFVTSSDDCLGTSDYDCIAKLGGVYDLEGSKTEKNSSTIDGWNGTINPDYSPADYYYHNDILTFGPNDTKVYGWPFTTDLGKLWCELKKAPP